MCRAFTARAVRGGGDDGSFPLTASRRPPSASLRRSSPSWIAMTRPTSSPPSCRSAYAPTCLLLGCRMPTLDFSCRSVPPHASPPSPCLYDRRSSASTPFPAFHRSHPPQIIDTNTQVRLRDNDEEELVSVGNATLTYTSKKPAAVRIPLPPPRLKYESGAHILDH